MYQRSELRTFHTSASSTVSALGSDLTPARPARREKMNDVQSSSVIIIWMVAARSKWDRTSRGDTGMSPEGSIAFLSGGIVKTPPPLAHPAHQSPLLRHLLPLRYLGHDLSSSPTEFPSKDISPQKRYTQDLTPGACGRALIRKQSLQMELGQESCFIFFLTLVFWPRGIWDLNSPVKDQTHTLCTGS